MKKPREARADRTGQQPPPFTDIHCHLLPGVDDGARDEAEAVAMAKLAVAEGIRTIIVTPHQLGGYAGNSAEALRRQTLQLQALLDTQRIPLRVLPGADVRIEPDLADRLRRDEVLTLGDHRRHVLLELPHELYFPLEPLLASLERQKLVGILSHPERNQGILTHRKVLRPLVEAGCLMQVTCGSLLGTFGPQCQELSEWMLREGLVHFLATDAHGARRRRPRMRDALERAARIVGLEEAVRLCCEHPAAVAAGQPHDRPVKTSRELPQCGPAATAGERSPPAESTASIDDHGRADRPPRPMVKPRRAAAPAPGTAASGWFGWIGSDDKP